LPAVLYGKTITATPIHVSLRDLKRQVPQGRIELMDLEVEGEGTYPVMLTAIQRDPISGEWLHADFHQVNLDEPVRTKVPLDFHGTAVGTKAGGILQIQETHIEIEALPEHMPASIAVDISGLDIGDKLLVGDLSLPSGVHALSHPDELLISVVLPQTAASDPEVQADTKEPSAS
jgi:large subunit ribosomal protein L25